MDRLGLGGSSLLIMMPQLNHQLNLDLDALPRSVYPSTLLSSPRLIRGEAAPSSSCTLRHYGSADGVCA